MNAWTTNTRITPFNAKLKTLLGSDIGHKRMLKTYAIAEAGVSSPRDCRRSRGRSSAAGA